MLYGFTGVNAVLPRASQLKSRAGTGVAVGDGTGAAATVADCCSAASDGAANAAIVGVLFILIFEMEGHLLAPNIVSRTVALSPLTVLLALLIGGVVVTETVFAIPGLGRLTVDAILRRDYPIIQGIILIFSGAYVLINLLVDLSYGFIDPRIRHDR